MKKKRLGKFIWIIIIVFCLGAFVDNNETSSNKVYEESYIFEDVVTVDETTEKSEKTEDVEANGLICHSNKQETILEDNNRFEVHYIDVGQADASLIICDEKSMLIDGGNSEDSSLIYAYLKEHEITEIEYMICTHVHEDHVGGLAGALNYAKVNNVLCPARDYDTQAFQSFLKYVNEQNKEIIVPNPGMEFPLGSAWCTILGVNTIENDPNNSSIVMKIEYGETSFLFCGDAEQEVETKILDAGYDPSCTVMKVPHHGSDSSLSYRWLNESMPEYGVISVGSNNQYGHPNENTLSKLRDADVSVYRTDLQGHIVCHSDGYKLTFDVERNETINTLEDAGVGSKNVSENKGTEVVIEEEGKTIQYVLNINTKKIHYPSCSSLSQMKEKNKQETNLSREELIAQGYSPCGRCNP